jgi:hypothetical protein
LNAPKNRKTREGAISDGMIALIKEWADLAQDPTPDGFVFPPEKLTTPLSLDNLWRRYMCPKLAAVGLEWATFQVLRKTNASLSKKAGIDLNFSPCDPYFRGCAGRSELHFGQRLTTPWSTRAVEDAVPSDFVLYGRTGLALQLGHRALEDFDFFSSSGFDPDRLRSSCPSSEI